MTEVSGAVITVRLWSVTKTQSGVALVNASMGNRSRPGVTGILLWNQVMAVPPCARDGATVSRGIILRIHGRGTATAGPGAWNRISTDTASNEIRCAVAGISAPLRHHVRGGGRHIRAWLQRAGVGLGLEPLTISWRRSPMMLSIALCAS